MFDAVYADPDAKAITEINHLIEFVKKSEVVFIRNGKEYPVEDAVKLINNKYGSNKKKIKTAEDFIEKSATKSEHSGLPYQIKFKDATTKESGKWLLEELIKFREKPTVEEKK